MFASPKITPAPKIWPKQAVPMTAGKPKPPKRLAEGIAGPALGYLIVYLPKAMAMILQTIITAATFGPHARVVGTAANTVE